MKVKISVTVSKALLKRLDEILPDSQNRSAFLEAAAWAHIAKLRRTQQNRCDLEILNAQAEYFHEEAMNVLDYQVDL